MRTGPTALVTSATLVVLASAGCSTPAGDPPPAPQASAAACTQALAAAPALILDQARTPVSTAGALAWGDPAIVLRCGLPEPAPSTLTCLEVNGIDWVIDETKDPMTAVSYGRSPAAELRVPASYGASALPSALVDATPIAQALPATDRACIG